MRDTDGMFSTGQDSEGRLEILYLGSNNGTSLQRAQSLRRLGHAVSILDPERHLPSGRLPQSWMHHTGALGFGSFVRTRVNAEVGEAEFDVIWVDGGSLISPELLRDLKSHARVTINYNIDDPYGTRDSNKWRLYRRAVPEYDLVVVVRDCNLAEAFQLGAKDALLVLRSADEVAHAPRQLSSADVERWASEVAFVGTWLPERGAFLARLIQLGVPLALWGDRWMNAGEAAILRPCWRGPAIYGDDYALAIQSAKVCIGMLSKGNRDLSTTRTFEIPHLGGLLCAERTREHEALYQEDVEAVFWSSADECAEKCDRLIRDERRRVEVARRGRLRCLRNRTTNQHVMKHILSRVTARLRPQAAELSSRCQQ